MSTSGGGSTSSILLKLVIVEPKTHVPLWWFTESFAGDSHTVRRRSVATLIVRLPILWMT